MGKILLISTDKVGDLIWTIPSIRLIKTYLSAEVFFVASRYAGNILCNNPYIDHLLSVNRHVIRARAIVSAIRAGLMLRKHRIQFAIQFNAWSPNDLIIKVAGAKYVKKYNPHQHNISRDKKHHVIRRLLFVSEALGIQYNDPPTVELYSSAEDEMFVQRILHEFGVQYPYIVIHPGSSGLQKGARKTKEWPISNYSKLIPLLLSSINADIVLIGSKKESGQIQESIIKPLPPCAKGNVHNLAGRTSLSHLRPLIDKAALFIGSDSGPIHIASSTNVPIVGIYGPTDPEVSGPFRVDKCIIVSKRFPCSPCSRKVRKRCDRSCLISIVPEDVFEACMKLLSQSKS